METRINQGMAVLVPYNELPSMLTQLGKFEPPAIEKAVFWKEEFAL